MERMLNELTSKLGRLETKTNTMGQLESKLRDFESKLSQCESKLWAKDATVDSLKKQVTLPSASQRNKKIIRRLSPQEQEKGK